MMCAVTEPGRSITCQEIVEVVTDYLEGLVDEATRVEIETHLALCAGCEEYIGQMRTTRSALGHIPVDSLSDTAKAALLASFRDYRRST